MKILHVYKTYYPEDRTGIPNAIYTLAEELSSIGTRSTVLALFGPKISHKPFTLDSHQVYPSRRLFTFASSSFGVNVFRDFKRAADDADIVHYHFPWPVADLLHETICGATPAVVTYHSDIVRQKRLGQLYSPLMMRFLRKVDAIVATSPDYVRSSKVLGQFPDKTVVIPIGLEEAAPPAPSRVAHWRKRLGSGFTLFVGAIRYYKGVDILVAAASQTPARIVIVGDDKEGILASLDLPANVTYLGAVDDGDKLALLELCSSFVLPSHLRSEAFGIALLEAARAGRAMISCEIGTGTTFVNLNNETGLTVPAADARALAAAITQLHHDTDMAARMGQAARRRFEGVFKASTMATAYNGLYRQVLAAHRHSS